METSTPTPESAVSVSTFTRNPLAFKISFAVVALMFLLPFVEFRCNGVTLTRATGIDLAFGFEMKQSKTMDNWSNSFNWNDNKTNAVNTNTDRRKKDPNSFALAALVLAVAGFGFSFIKFRQLPFLSMVIGVLGTIAMIGLMIKLNTDIKNEATIQGAEYGVKISYDYTFWYFLSVIGFVTAAFIGWRQSKKKPQPASG